MVAIITLNFNQNEYTLKCINSILKSENIDFKFLVVDNGSSSQNYKELKKEIPKDDRVILERIHVNKGYVGGINHGLKFGEKINPAYVLIMNNDTIIEENAIFELVRTCKKFENEAIVTGKVYHYDEPTKIQDVGYIFDKKEILKFKRIGLNEIDQGQFDLVTERDMLDDVFWLFPYELYKRIGGYSNYFWFNAEQADFALRAKKMGYKLIYTHKAKLWHKGSVSIGGRDTNPKLAYWNIQSSLMLRYLHLNKFNFLNFFIITTESVLRTSFKAFIFRMKGDKTLLKYAMAKRKGLYYFLKWVVIRNENKGENPIN